MTAPEPTTAAYRLIRLSILGLLCLLGGAAAAQTASSQRTLPPAVESLLDATPLPAVSVGPRRRHILLVHRRGLLPDDTATEPLVSVGGLLVNPGTLTQHAPLAYFAITVIDLRSGERRSIQLPGNVTIGFPQWSPDGTRFAFTVTDQDGMELWLATPEGSRPRRLLGPILNGATGRPCRWMPDSRRLVCQRRLTPEPVPVPAPQFAHLRTGLPLEPSHEIVDEETAADLLEARLEIVTLSGQRRPLGQPAMFESVEPAPGGELLLVTRRLRPYIETAYRSSPLRRTEIWSVADPDAEPRAVRPASDARPRAVRWHASEPATLLWAEQIDGQDRVLSQAAPFDTPPRLLFSTPHHFAGLELIEQSSRALISIFDAASRTTEVWNVGTEGAGQPLRLGSRSVDAPFPQFGWPVPTVNSFGKNVIAMRDGGIYLRGEHDGETGVTAHLDFQPLDGSASERLWQTNSSSYEPVIELLLTDGELLLTRSESAHEPANYVLHDLESGTRRALTYRRHPAPALKQARSIPLRYSRPDGYRLSSTLHLPPARDADDPPPLVVWAYPRQYGADTRSIAAHRPERFLDFERAFKLFFLLEGYAVIDDLAMPVIGDAADANDTFIPQVTANARSAIAAARSTRLVDTERVGVAGHSYGAFMVANLLAHSRLFDAGIALSGAYNRTLTPFGFQTERRTLWEARETYLSLSPLLYSDRIEAPLLLVHGLLDRNAGTQPIQSVQFYEAIRRTGGEAGLLLLPQEDHNYRARKSVLETAAAMLDWFDRHLKRAPANPVRTDAYANVPASADADG